VYVLLRSDPPIQGITLREIVYRPAEFHTEDVRISARVKDILDPRAIVVGNDRVISREDMLIVSTVPLEHLAGRPIREDELIEVMGTVQTFEVAEFELEHGVDFQYPARMRAYSLDTAIMAESIVLNPRENGQDDTENPLVERGNGDGVSARDVVYNTERYLGHTVTVSGEIEEHLSPTAFILSDQGIVVIGSEPFPDVLQEATAYVQGQVRRFDRAALEAELGIVLEAELFAVYKGWPVIVASPESVVVVR
jgi:hypothetical protein